MARRVVERRPLTPAELSDALAALPGWQERDGALHRELSFADFSEAWGFMARVALEAEKLDHHPDWSNSWATVRIGLRTHDLDCISTLDVELARRVDVLAG